MEEAGEHLRCVHLVHAAGAHGAPEPTLLCACPAGLVHMHDCPVSMGRACVHFRPRAGEPAATPPAEVEALHDRLMEDFLTRPYFARVRTLAPGGAAALERRRALEEDYAAFLRDLEEETEGEAADAEYERERERLREQRRRAAAARADREKGLDAAERARRGIKTVVERAQETVAASGNVASSYVDEIELPRSGASGGAGAPEGGKRRRRRRRKPGGGEGGGPPAGAVPAP